MRKRNIKVNVFLNEVEKKMLEEKSKNSKLSQSDFIRTLIRDFKQEKPTKNNDMTSFQDIILNNINDLIKLKKQIHYLGYFREEEYLQNIITNFESIAKEPH